MEENKTQKIEIVSQANTIASPGPAVTFTFSVYSVISWAVMTGVFGEGAGLSLGIVQVCGAVAFTIMSAINTVRGNPFGAVNMIFAFAFGLFGGVNGIANTFFAMKGIPTNVAVAGVVNFMAGVFVVAILPTLLTIPAYQFIYNAAAGIGLAILGAAQILGWGNGFYVVAGWCFLVTGVLGWYHAVSETCENCGVNLFPQGPALKK